MAVKINFLLPAAVLLSALLASHTCTVKLKAASKKLKAKTVNSFLFSCFALLALSFQLSKASNAQVSDTTGDATSAKADKEKNQPLKNVER